MVGRRDPMLICISAVQYLNVPSCRSLFYDSRLTQCIKMKNILRKELERKLVTAEGKLITTEGNRHRGKFLPHGHEAELITFDNIKNCIPEIPVDLAHFVYEQARKVFAILVHSKCQDGDLQDALRLCREYGLTDQELPIPDVDGVCFNEIEGDAKRECEHGPHLNIFHEDDWGSSAWGSFYRGQWYFLSPVFRCDTFEYNFPQGTILPIIRYGLGNGEGYFGAVVEAFLHVDHLQGFPKVCGPILELI